MQDLEPLEQGSDETREAQWNQRGDESDHHGASARH